MNSSHRWKAAGWVVAAWLAAATGNLAWGSDFWLEADPTAPGKPSERSLHLREGEGFRAGEERPLQKERTGRFDLYVDQARRRDLLAAGQEGQVPVAKLPPEPSACLVVMERKEAPGTVNADRFNRTLADEGQEAVVAQRARQGQSTTEGKEIVYRYLKALVPGQESSSTLPNTFYKRRVAQRLEVLLQNNPGRLQANHRLTVKVLFDGKPLAGVKVFAYRRDGGVAGQGGAMPGGGVSGSGPITVTTGAEGLASFKVDQNGAWLVRAGHLRSGAERKTNPNEAWENFEATYTFVTRDVPVAAVAAASPASKE